MSSAWLHRKHLCLANRMVVCSLGLGVHGCGGRGAQNSSCPPYTPCLLPGPCSPDSLALPLPPPPPPAQCPQLGTFTREAAFPEPPTVLCPQKGSTGSERGSGWPYETLPGHGDPLIKPSLQLQAQGCFRVCGWRRRNCSGEGGSSLLLEKLLSAQKKGDQPSPVYPGPPKH